MEEKIQKIMQMTSGNGESQAKYDASAFKWLDSSSDLKEFCQWFTENISEDNCLTSDELREYKLLKAEGSILEGEELDKQLNEFYKAPPDTLPPFENIYLQNSENELQAAKDRLETLKKLHEVLLEDEKRITDDLLNTKLCLESANKNLNENIKSVFMSNNQYFQQLEKVVKQSSETQDNLLQLNESITLGEEKTKSTFCSTNTSIQRSFQHSLMKPLKQKQYLFQMDFRKIERLNESFLEDLNSLIRRHIDKPSRKNKNLERGDFTNSTFFIQFRGIEIDVEMEFKRLSQSLNSIKNEKVLAELDVIGVNKAISHLQHLKNDMSLNIWQPSVSQMRLKTLDFMSKIKELENNFSSNSLILVEYINDWTYLTLQEAMKDLMVTKISRKKFLLKNISNVFDILFSQEAYNLFILILLEQEEQRIITLANFISEVWSGIESEATRVREEKILIETNQNDYYEFLSRPELERNGIIMRLTSLMNSEISDLFMNFGELQNKIKSNEINLFSQLVKLVQILNQKKNSLESLKQIVFSGPVNEPPIINHNFYPELEKMKERILKLALILRCTKMEFIQTQRNIKQNPSLREQQLFWVKFLLNLEQLNETNIKSELPEVKEDDYEYNTYNFKSELPEIKEEHDIN